MKNAVFILLFALVASMCPAADERKEAPFVRSVSVSAIPGGRHGVAELEFDDAMYRALNAGMTNLRIRGSDGVIPFAMREKRQAEQVPVFTPVEGKITSFRVDRKNNTAFIGYEFKKEYRDVARLSFDSPTREFNKTVGMTFYGPGGKTGSAGALPFFRHTRNVDLFQFSIDFAPVTASRAEIEIHNFSERVNAAPTVERTGSGSGNNFTEQRIAADELRLDRIEFKTRRMETVYAKPLCREVALKPAKTENSGTATVLRFETGKLPLCRFRLETDTKAFDRRVTAADQDGHMLADTRVSAGTGWIDLPERRGEYLVVRIENGDDAPLSGIRLKWLAKRHVLLMSCDVPHEFKVYYGGNLIPKSYDMEKTLGEYALPQFACRLGAQQSNPEFSPAVPMEGLVRYGIDALIILAVVLLLYFSLRAYNGMKPEE